MSFFFYRNQNLKKICKSGIMRSLWQMPLKEFWKHQFKCFFIIQLGGKMKRKKYLLIVTAITTFGTLLLLIVMVAQFIFGPFLSLKLYRKAASILLLLVSSNLIINRDTEKRQLLYINMINTIANTLIVFTCMMISVL